MKRGPAVITGKVYEHYSHWFPVMLKAAGTTIGHHIFYEMDERRVGDQLRRHELIHVEQCERHTTIGFLVMYFLEYFKYRLEGLPHWQAYRKISFEVEAFTRQDDI